MTDFTDFAKPLDTYVEDFTERQEAVAQEAGDTNPLVHERRLGLPVQYPNHQQVPCCLYFYYLGLTPESELDVRHYFYRGGDPADPANPADRSDWPAIPNEDDVLIPILQGLIANARNGGNTYPLIGSGFEGIRWYRKSYVALFIDEASWSLYQESETDRAAIVFVTDENEGKHGTPNHSFFDGRNLSIPMPEGDSRSAFVCVNHMKRDAAGTDLQPGDEQNYVFKLFFSVEFVGGQPPLTVIFDPDGTNEGPPIGPP